MAPVLSLPEGSLPYIETLRKYVTLEALDVPTEDVWRLGMRERFKIACRTWAHSGLGTPVAVHGYYVVKAVLYLLGFWHLQRRHAGGGFWRKLRESSALRRDAFARLVAYNLLFEVLGLGCGSGPLTGRLLPPHTSWFHFLCPGTMKLPFRLNARDDRQALIPALTTRRSKKDVLLFVAYLLSLLRAVTAKRLTPQHFRPICACLGALCIVDHTAFLASRGDVYGYMAVAHAAGAPIVGSQLVQLAVYFWAAFSKLGPWFPHVIQAMLSNSPCFPRKLRSHLYSDVAAGNFAVTRVTKGLAAVGAGLEIAIPALLPCGGLLAKFGMFCSLSLHAFIFTNVAVGCPQEWNLFTPMAAYYLFLDASDGMDWRSLRQLPASHPLLAAFLMFVLGVVPALGNVYPPSNSFLTSMKYYAGNWPSTTWLVKRSAWHKFDKLLTLSDFFPEQNALLYGKEWADLSVLKVYSFRTMHLPYKMLPKLLEIALQGKNFDDYRMADGEIMAGVILGYNFGDGYLHGRYMVQAVQDVCCFEPGELLHVSIDSCPTLGDEVPWFVRDATALWEDDKALGIGKVRISELQQMNPY